MRAMRPLGVCGPWWLTNGSANGDPVGFRRIAWSETIRSDEIRRNRRLT